MLSIPIIGIGSGCGCDGQVLVLHDMLGIYEDIKPKFVKRYAEFSKLILEAILQYTNDVKSSRFPEEQNIFHMNPDELNELNKALKRKNSVIKNGYKKKKNRSRLTTIHQRILLV